MFIAIIILAAMLGLGVLGSVLYEHSGSKVIFILQNDFLWVKAGEHRMEMWYFFLIAMLIIIALLIAFKIIWTIIRIPAIGKRFGRSRRDTKAGHLLQKGMLAMGKGQWKKAENILAKGARVSYKGKQDTGLFLTAAAQAAQQQGANDRRDQYLLEARMLEVDGHGNDDTFSAALAEAQLHLDANEPKQALSVLKAHHTSNYENPRLQALESQAYEQLEQYGEVWRLLKNQRRAFADKSAYRARQSEVAKAVFSAQKHSNLETIEKVWSELPSSEKRNDTLMLAYVSSLINHDNKDKAEHVLSKQINHTFSDPLVHAYTQLEVGSSRERLDKLAGWVQSRPDNAYLNYGAAKLAFQCDELERAKAYAERSVKSQAIPEALALLGKIYEKLGQENNALQAYRTSLGMTYVEHQGMSGEVLTAPETTKGLTSDSEHPARSTSNDNPVGLKTASEIAAEAKSTEENPSDKKD